MYLVPLQEDGNRSRKIQGKDATWVSWVLIFCALWAAIQQKYPWLWKYVENVLWASCSFIFFFPLNYCDPTAKHYSVMYPLKLARGLLGKFNVFLWCLHGTSMNMNGKFFSTKGCSSSSTENLGKIEDSVCLTFSFGAGLLMREHLEALFHLPSQELGGLSGKFPPSLCGFSLSWWFSSSWGDLWLAESIKLCSVLKLEDLKRIWGFGWIQLLGRIWCSTLQVKGAALLGFLVWLLAFFFIVSFFHVDKAVFNVL